jgi:hypothetical protein
MEQSGHTHRRSLREAVEVLFDSSVVSYKELLIRAKAFHPYEKDKYYLSSTPYRFVPMTPLQAILVNRALYQGENPAPYLSPRQLAILKAVENRPIGGWKDRLQSGHFIHDWYEVAREAGLQM